MKWDRVEKKIRDDGKLKLAKEKKRNNFDEQLALVKEEF